MAVAPYKVDGRAMAKARYDKGLSMREIARYMQVNKSSVWRWEWGQVTPRPRSLRIYSMLVGKKPADFIIEGSENGHEPS